MLIKPSTGEEQYVAAEVGDDGAVEFNTLDPKEQNRIGKLLEANNKSLLSKVMKDYKAKRIVNDPTKLSVSTSQLLALGDEIAKMRSQKRKPARSQYAPILKQLSPVEGDDETTRDIKNGLLQQLRTIEGVEVEADANAEQIGPDDTAAYKRDILEMGVYAGPGEASTLGEVHQVMFDIWTIDSDGKFRKVYPNLGAGNRTGRDLVHLGNHYVVVNTADLQDGKAAPVPLRVVAKTEELGDCLFEGFYIVQHGQKPGNYNLAITALRQDAEQNISDVAVETSVALIRDGSRLGLGTNMQARLAGSPIRTTANAVIARAKTASSSSELDPFLQKQITSSLKGFEDKRARDEQRGVGDDGAALVYEEDTQEAFELLVGALGDFGLPKKTESGTDYGAALKASDQPVELGRYVYATEETTAVSQAANNVGKEVKAPGIKHMIGAKDFTELLGELQDRHLDGKATTFETDWARHDIQNGDTHIYSNFQIQMGGKRLRPKGMEKTSFSMVAVDSRVLAGRGPEVFQMIVNAHRLSYLKRKVIISLNDKDGVQFIAARRGK